MRLLLSVVVMAGACGGGMDGTTPPPGPAPRAHCEMAVREPLVVPTTSQPAAVAVSDVDGDQRPDVVVTHPGTGTIGALRGAQDGLMAEVTSSVGPRPFGLALDDFDHDGHVDAAVTISNDDLVGVLLGHGDGTFAAPVMLPVGDDPQKIFAADVDGDGWTDLVVADRDAGTVTILGNTAGSFAPIGTLSAGTPLDALAVGDLDGDGDIDVVTAYDFSTVKTFLNDGHGVYAAGPMQTIPGGNEASALALADLDGDGALDLAVTHNGGLPTFAVVSVLMGHGDGSFGDEVRYFTHDIQQSIAAMDIDGDHVVDLVTVDNWNASITVLIGQGDGTFHEPVMLAAAGEYGASIALADIDGDQHADIVIGAATVSTVTVLYGHPNALPNAPMLYPIGGAPTGGAVADLDGDGATDVVASISVHDGQLRVVYGDGHGDGTMATIPAQNPSVVAAGDLTGDGRPDLVVGDAVDQTVYVLVNQGNRAFTASPAIPVGASPQAIALGDLDGDHKPDVVVAAGSILVLRNTGAGNLGQPRSFDAGLDAVSLALGDVDGDHHLDVVAGARGEPWGTGSDDTPSTGSGTDAGIALLRGDGSAQLDAPHVYAAGNGQIYVAVGDIDGDGSPDIAATSALDDTVAIWHGDGHGAFVAGATYDAGLAPSSVEITDVTGDTIPDLLIADLGNTVDLHFTISILPGQQDGTLGPRESHTTSVHPVAALAGDLDNDAHADVVVINSDAPSPESGTVMFLLESCRPL